MRIIEIVVNLGFKRANYPFTLFTVFFLVSLSGCPLIREMGAAKAPKEQ